MKRAKTHLSIIVLLFHSAIILAQKKIQADYLSEFNVTSENDAYNYTFHDGYYTNGLFLQYSAAAKTKNRSEIVKKINQYQLGQMIFNSDHYISRISDIDRPFSGYLFISKRDNWFYKNGNIMVATAETGASGKASLASEVQNLYHKILYLPKINGWKFGLNSEWALNAKLKYYLHILKPENIRKVDLFATGALSLGNTFTNAGAGLLLRLGAFESPENSGFFNARIGKGTAQALKRSGEIFFYFHPMLNWQAYNATVQGPLFKKDKGPFVSDIARVLYMHQFGFYTGSGRVSASFQITIKQKEATTMVKKNENYGSIMVAYRFGSRK